MQKRYWFWYNRELFKEWLLWVDFVNNTEDEEKFIKRSLERYANIA